MQGDNGAHAKDKCRPETAAGGDATMNRSIFWRVFWKEYRLQRALWIAMAVLTSMLLLLERAVTPHPQGPP